MFHPLGLFKETQCPRQHDCSLQNCVFSHEFASVQPDSNAGQAYDPLSAGDYESPPAKRRRINSPEPVVKTANSSVNSQHRSSPGQKLRPTPCTSTETEKIEPQRRELDLPRPKTITANKPLQLASTSRTVSPPPTRNVKTSPPEKVEKLIPRPVAQSPATLKVRMALVEVLYKYMELVNSQINGSDIGLKGFKLTDQKLISWALDEEQQAASTLASDIYRNAMSQKALQMKRMKLEDWKTFVSKKLDPKTSDEKKIEENPNNLSPDEEIQILRYLRTNLTGLDTHGYVTKAPSAADIQKAKEAIRVSGGYEVCDRCGIRFQVFPGRDEQGRLTTKGECHYHWAKLMKGQWHKTDHITGQSLSGYPCCGQAPGSEGCTKASTHVFKVADPKRLAVLLQFEQTPSRSDDKKCGPISFDCEMAYTTHGMEVVRVTAVSWPQNREVLDILVRPYGEILDLNTRFSGVTQEQYTTALPYDTASDQTDNTSEDREIEVVPLRKVDSPATARRLMFDLLSPDTPLIGHAIDNDLNTCRMIHPFVVDTILLYPHPRGLPIRYGLKMLASKHLSRSIQSGGDAGHDSKEDSIATGDLVRLKVAEKWQMMRLQGWKLNDGVLVAPSR